MFRFRACVGASFVVALILTLLPTGQGLAHGQPEYTPEVQAAALIRPAIVYIETAFGGYVADSASSTPSSDEYSAPALRCTGFVVTSDGYIATAAHCLEPNPDWQPGGTRDNAGAERQILVSGAGQTGDTVSAVPARVVNSRPLGAGDVALLKVEVNDLPSAELSRDPTPQVGTAILSVGYPGSTGQVTDFSLEPTSKSGSISATKTQGTQPVIEVSAPMSKGMSGGPTVNLEGQVIGINSFAPKGEVQPFNYIVPVSGVTELLKGEGIEAKPSPADNAYRSGLTDYYNGNYTDAIGDFDTALALSPNYPGAFDMRTDSVKLREQYGDSTSSSLTPWMWLAGGVVVAALVAGAIVYYLRTRRSEAPLPAPAGSWQGEQPPAASNAAPTRSPSGGSASSAPSGNENYCKNCGLALAPDQRFCPRCGKPQ